MGTLHKGFSTEYAWAQVGSAAARRQAAGHYIGAAEGGEPPGRWWGPGARTLGFHNGQEIERKPYDLVFGQRVHPLDGTRLGRRRLAADRAAEAIYAHLLQAEPHATAQRKRELRDAAAREARQSPPYFDLTFSLSKGVSLFHASLGENARRAHGDGDAEAEAFWACEIVALDEMIYAANEIALEFFQVQAGYTRLGAHAGRVNGRETGEWREADLAVASWYQHTSRDGDPQLHVHNQILHAALTRHDGKWRAPDSYRYGEHVGAAAQVFVAELESRTTRRWGLEWVRRPDGYGHEIKGISQELMEEFSSRRATISARVADAARRYGEEHGRPPSTDGGTTWAKPQRLSASFNNSSVGGRQGCMVRTDSHGVVYVVWEDAVNHHNVFKMSRSFDGGATFGKAFVVAQVTDVGVFDGVRSISFDGIAGARTSSFPSLDIANGAPTGAGAPNTIALGWSDGSDGLNHEHALVQLSSDQGQTWTSPQAVEQAGDRPDFAFLGLSPNGKDLYVVYDAFLDPFQTNTTDPRRFQGVVRHADVSGTSLTNLATLTRGDIGDGRASSANALIDEFIGDYNTVAATNAGAVAVYNDAHNAAVCDAINAYRQSVVNGSPGPAPAPATDCPATFGNTDIFSAMLADPTP